MTGGPRGKDGPDVREMVPEMDGTLIGLEDGGREYPNSGKCELQLQFQSRIYLLMNK